MPVGITLLGRWHASTSTGSWLLVEDDNVTALAQILSEWAGLLEIEVSPLSEVEQAAGSASVARCA
jgi:hypothetical protein